MLVTFGLRQHTAHDDFCEHTRRAAQAMSTADRIRFKVNEISVVFVQDYKCTNLCY